MPFGVHPALIVLVSGTILYFAHAVVRGRTNLYQVWRALKADFKISLLILISTFIIADYFLYKNPVNSYPIYLLKTVIAILLGVLLSKRLTAFYRLTG